MPAAQFLNAYSIPAQPGTSGENLIFDRNGDSNGTAVTHTVNSSDVTVQTPGYYAVSFHGTLSPGSGNTFPMSVILNLQNNGTPVPGTSVSHNFQSANETNNLAFSQIISVPTAPATLNVSSQGGSIQYNDISITVHKLSDI